MGLWISEGFLDRLVGIFKCDGDFLLLRRCSAVHGFGLAKPIHLVFLDGEFTVLDAPRILRPWLIVRFSHAAHVLESYRPLAVAPGDRLVMCESDI